MLAKSPKNGDPAGTTPPTANETLAQKLLNQVVPHGKNIQLGFKKALLLPARNINIQICTYGIFLESLQAMYRRISLPMPLRTIALRATEPEFRRAAARGRCWCRRGVLGVYGGCYVKGG